MTKPKNGLLFQGISPGCVNKIKLVQNLKRFASKFKEALTQSLTVYGLDQLLRYADRHSMRNSLELELPFLDHKLVEFTLGLPEEYLIKNAWRKYLLRGVNTNSLLHSTNRIKNRFAFFMPQEQFLKEDLINQKLRISKTKNLREWVISAVNPRLQ